MDRTSKRPCADRRRTDGPVSIEHNQAGTRHNTLKVNISSTYPEQRRMHTCFESPAEVDDRDSVMQSSMQHVDFYDLEWTMRDW